MAGGAQGAGEGVIMPIAAVATRESVTSDIPLSVVRCRVKFRGGQEKDVHARREIGRADAKAEGNAPRPPSCRRTAIAARAEQFANMSQERGLANAAGDQANVIVSDGLGKAVAE